MPSSHDSQAGPPQSTSVSPCPFSWSKQNASVGESVGESVGLSVFLQQPRKACGPSDVGQHSMPKPKPHSTHSGCKLQSLSFDGDVVGLAVGDSLGFAVGDQDGDSEGSCVGETVGLAVGASVFSQQVKYVVPSLAGQHRLPLLKPSALHLGCAAQSDSIVGERVGDDVGPVLGLVDGPALGDTVGLVDGESLGPVVGDPVGDTEGSTVGEIVGLVVGASVFLQHGKNAPSTPGQHAVPFGKPNAAHSG